MRAFLLAALLVLPGVALAQSTTTGPTGTATGNPTMGTGTPSTMDQSAAGTAGSRFHQTTGASQEDMRKSLEQAGFRNVQFLDSAMVVQAQTADGKTVMMTISEPPMAAGSSGGTTMSEKGSAK